MRRAILAAAAALALALAGCSAPANGGIETIGQLSAAYIDAGGSCDDLVEQYRADPDEPVVATCGTETVLTLAADSAAADQVGTGYVLREEPVLVSGRWLIADPDIETLQEQLGGEILTLEQADGPANMADAIAFGAAGVVEQEPVPAGGSPSAAAPTGLEITVVVDAQCDYCATFFAANRAQLVDLAASGTATVAYRVVSLEDSVANQFASTMAANALACVANEQPAAFRDVLAALFESQSEAGWSPEDLATIGEQHDTDITACVDGGQFLSWVRDATTRALSEPLANGEPLRGVPTVIVGADVFAGDVADPAAFAAFVADRVG